MVDYATEEEQVEALKRWWRENGTSIIVGAVIGIAALVGWRGWTWYQESQALAASAVYDRLTAQIDSGSREKLVAAAEELRAQYDSTAYATLGALAAGRAAVDAGDLAGAADWLRWAVDNADHARLGYLARARLARVVGEQGSADQALSVLDVDYPSAWTGVYAEIRGDILIDQGKRQAAAEAYRAALDAEVPPPDPQLVQRKLNQLETAAGADGGTGDEAS